MPTVVRDIMSVAPATIARHATVDDALALLLEAAAAEVYVCESGNLLVGVIPDYELLKLHWHPGASAKDVSALMSPNLATVAPDATVSEIAPLFRAASCARLAVVESGRLVGQVARRDVLRAIVSRPLPEAAEPSTRASDSEMPAPRFLQTRAPVRAGK